MTTPWLYDADDAVVSLTPTPCGIALTITQSDGPHDLEMTCTFSASTFRALLADAAATLPEDTGAA